LILAVVAFDVAVAAAGDLGELLFGKGDDLLVQFLVQLFVDILIHLYYLSFIPLRLSGGVRGFSAAVVLLITGEV